MSEKATYKSMESSVPEDWAIVSRYQPANRAKLPDALEDVA